MTRAHVVHLVAVFVLGSALAQPAQTHAAAQRPFKVVLDAGHGGSDPGAVSPLLNATEEEVALRVALLTGAALERRGVQVVQTRTRDVDVPLGARAALALGTGADALVSVHLNASPNPSALGAEVWHGQLGAVERHAELAATLLDALAPALLAGAGGAAGSGGVRGIRAGGQLAVLRTAVPAALVELGYVTNAADAHLLGQPAFHAAAAEALAEGVVRFRDGRTQARARAAQTAVPKLYFARPGDTLHTIAVRLGVSHQALSVLGISPAQPTGAQAGPQVGQPVRVLLASSGAGSSVPSTMPAAALPARGAAVTTPGRLPSAAPGALQAGTYVVAPGETLSAIASKERVSVRDLASWNGLSDVDLIRTGQRLRVALPGTAAGHVMRPGETLSHVSLTWGTSVEAVRRANQLTDADRVEAGRLLVRPAA